MIIDKTCQTCVRNGGSIHCGYCKVKHPNEAHSRWRIRPSLKAATTGFINHATGPKK